MKIVNLFLVVTCLVSLLFSSCLPDNDLILEKTEAEETEIEETEVEVYELESLDIPDGFNFSTKQQVTVNITDEANYVIYEVYAYSDEMKSMGTESFENQKGEIERETVYKSEVLQNLIFSGTTTKGELIQHICIPNYFDKLYIRRNENLEFSSSIVDINNGNAIYEYSGKSKNAKTEVVSDYLYGVNGSAELFQVDPIDGKVTYLSDMPMGSWTAAIDQENKALYSIGRSQPYPLMKYSIEYSKWEIVGDLGIGGPRLGYNNRDGLLYFSRKDELYTINPEDGSKVDRWKINGLHDTGGGDLAFAEDGTLFLCTFSGLYELELDANGNYQSNRISADKLPFNPTSMTFDSNQELWLANNASSADLIIMDTQTGGWQYNYGNSANNGSEIGRAINDLTTFRVFTEVGEDKDTDGDGIMDRDDHYPDDADRAFESYSPSKYGWGTVAFEDLWPSNGDYDLNDLAVNYRVVRVLNAKNEVVQLDVLVNVASMGAAFSNGFGIELESLSPTQIESVSGTSLIHDYIIENSNGTEAGQENAVIILFDDPYAMHNNQTTVTVKFKEPISTDLVGNAPFNPFIIIDKTREREVHLPSANTTSLGKKYFEISGSNRDKDGNYLSDNGMPWAIDIMHDFKVAKEKIPVNEAYEFFIDWVVSGGEEYRDWYKDNPGYRNSDKIND